MEREKLEDLREKLLNAINNPDLDVDIFFNNENKPYIKVKYIVEEHNVYEKEIDIEPEFLSKGDLKDVLNFALFQIQQFMEEIDSVEYGGE